MENFTPIKSSSWGVTKNRALDCDQFLLFNRFSNEKEKKIENQIVRYERNIFVSFEYDEFCF